MKDGETWIKDPDAKANLFAKIFDKKAELPPEEIDCPYFGMPDMEFEDFVALRSRTMFKLLSKLDVSKATGPDCISAEMLKHLAKELSVPLSIICRRLFKEACWPSAWKLHHICPLYKRGLPFLGGNYRGIHLTSILSKIAEKFIGGPLMQYLQKGKFGKNQWAFTPGLSSRDLVTALILSWILCICLGEKVAAYLSDITGAFDRVFKDFLLAKLYAAGVGVQYLNFLDSYLQPRKGRVIVEGIASDVFEIADTVFQGTVLGPCLWNVFFSDVEIPSSSTGGEEAMFADDLNVFKKYNRLQSNTIIKKEMTICRARVHKWGRMNRVSFDPGKEHIVIIHPIHADGDPFKLLGCMVDCKLVMNHAVDKILTQVRPKIRTILRTKKYYCSSDLINQFKTHIWIFVIVLSFTSCGIMGSSAICVEKNWVRLITNGI